MNEQQPPRQVRHLTILDILAAVASVACGASALNAEKTATESHIVVRWLIALALGFGCFCIMKIGLKSAATSSKTANLKLRNIQLFIAGILIIVGLGFVVASGVIASWVLAQITK